MSVLDRIRGCAERSDIAWLARGRRSDSYADELEDQIAALGRLLEVERRAHADEVRELRETAVRAAAARPTPDWRTVQPTVTHYLRRARLVMAAHPEVTARFDQSHAWWRSCLLEAGVDLDDEATVHALVVGAFMVRVWFVKAFGPVSAEGSAVCPHGVALDRCLSDAATAAQRWVQT